MANLSGRLTRMPNRTRPLLLLLTLGPVLLGWPAASAIETEQLDSVDDMRAGAAASADDRKHAREAELEAIRRSIEVSERRQNALRDEIAGLESDRARLRADLMATAQRLRRTEDEIGQIETRLEELHANEDGIRRSLHQRRAVMAEVLMALQRMGRTPPPAILSRPEDALAAIRGSILAGAVLPDIRVEAEALSADLAELTELTGRIKAERDSLGTRYAALGEEQTRIDLLVATKQTQREQTEAALSAERNKAEELAGRAGTLQSLIESLESEVAAAAKAAADAEAATRQTPPADRNEAARRLADTSRMAPAVRFADARGLLSWPVSGEKVLGFGEPDEYGAKSQGLSLATRPDSPVLAPADGWVLYAGPFRSYGQVLILNAGDGYHLVLAGMERVDATVGQFVLAGEPVATMGATRLASIGGLDHTSAQPILYVEFRKGGNAIDSAPWWAKATDGEVNG
jgi:septal ring factor EnvC (AmiA/AmiB activator)